ncbi:DUF4917 family protein [Amycolatopsis sp. lyj-112]|uniref:DUF4917 family protein n=1 Tax=Amycolatopsis sp. lyj-112 TaxID=2789288 RepID=UPI00397B8DD9
MDYDEAIAWLSETTNSKGRALPTRLILGNGFSIAFDPARFSYSALRSQAESQGMLSLTAQHLFHKLDTQDFEIVIKTLEDAAIGLYALDATKYSAEAAILSEEASKLKDALAHILAALHPERPYEIDDEAYLRVRRFLDQFDGIYTANYDLLLYWTLMQDFPEANLKPRQADDGFRDSGQALDYVVWNHLDPHSQSVFYLHGALHLYRSEDGLKKLTWRRTNEPLIDQIRGQLEADSFPLYVAEGTSSEKLTRIGTSDYLGRALRSLAAISGGLLSYGISFSKNDAHIMDAIVYSKITRLAVSLFGDVNSSSNEATIKAVQDMQSRRATSYAKVGLETAFFDAQSVRLWD